MLCFYNAISLLGVGKIFELVQLVMTQKARHCNKLGKVLTYKSCVCGLHQAISHPNVFDEVTSCAELTAHSSQFQVWNGKFSFPVVWACFLMLLGI